jgi:hypothetical protein
MIYQVGGAGAASWGVFGKVMQLLGLLGGFGGFLLLMVASGDSAFLLEGLVLIFSLLLLAGVAVEVVAISRLAEVYRLDGVRGKAISAAAVLWLGVVVAGVMPLIEPQLIFFSRTVEYFAVLIWAVLMWRVYKRFASFTGAFADAATWHDYHSLHNYYSYTTTTTLPTCRAPRFILAQYLDELLIHLRQWHVHPPLARASAVCFCKPGG